MNYADIIRAIEHLTKKSKDKYRIKNILLIIISI